MPNHVCDSQIIRFATFEVDLQAQELRKGGLRLKLSGQPFQVLAILLEQRGTVVTREELQKRLWPDTFVDIDHNLNTAINKIREALADSSENPRFVETLPRRGYRFIGQTESPQVHTTSPKFTNTPKLRSSGRLIIGIAIFVVFSAALLARFGADLILRQPGPSNALTPIPFTTYPGFEVAPSFSPDGSEIVFAWYRSGQGYADLYVKQVGDERLVRLTNRNASYIVPAWSPDGRKIAFATVDKIGSGIYLMPALGGSERRLAEKNANGWKELLLSWSPDSRELAFSKAGRIHLIDVETAEDRFLPLPSPDCINMEPAFSLDGTHVASVCYLADDGSRIYSQPSAGGEPREVTFVKGPALQGLAWTLDGQAIIYSAGDGSLWRVPAAGGPAQKLLFAHDTQTPVISRTGHSLAYPEVTIHPDIWRIELATKPTQPPTKLISSTRGQMNPHISPDGKRIVFESRRSGSSEIWVCDRDGSNLVQLSFFGQAESEMPRWSPDSRRIVFDSSVSGHAELYVVDANGGPPRRLATGTPNAFSPFWSADGRWIYFATDKPSAIWKVPSEGGSSLLLAKDAGYPQESADGQRLFYMAGVDLRSTGPRVFFGEVWAIPTSGGNGSRLEGMPPRNSHAWAPVQNGIYFIDGSPPRFSLNYFEFSSRSYQRVVELPRSEGVRGGISVSNSGDALLFSSVDHIDGDIMLVEGFR
jgi:Tol biopolymer transport system component/DNA-binding winged helix-turn-helix (wHTH) protein